MREMIKFIKKRACEIIVVFICMAVSCSFVSKKEGFHMDELLSFELANAEFNPWIVTTQPEGRLARFVHNEIDGETFGETMGNLADTVKDVLENRGNSRLLTYTAEVYEEPVWITAEQFSDYITVDGGDAFNYLSVYFNVKDDNHPPLHFMLLHTVSSLFQGRISPWMGCAVNLAAELGILILLYKICLLLAPALGLSGAGRRLGLMTVLFYGLSPGAVATVLLTRMYGMLTLWCVLYFYLVLEKWQEASFDRKNGKLILVTALGFWTQYFFLFYCVLLAAVVSVCLWRSRRRRELFCFVRSMGFAALTGLLVFPFAISDVFSSGRGVEALGNLSRGLAGYGTRLYAFGRLIFDRGIGAYCLLLLAMLAAIGLTTIWERKKEEKAGKVEKVERKGLPGELLWMLLLPVGGYFALAARMSPYLVDRYIMPLFPFVALIWMLAVFGFFRVVQENFEEWQTDYLIVVMCAGLVVFQLRNLAFYDGGYLYRGYSGQEATAVEYGGAPCICVYEGVGYYENLLEFTHYGKSLLLTMEELEGRVDRGSIEELNRVAVLVKQGVDEGKVLEILTGSYGFEVEREMEYDPGAYGDKIFILGKDS